MKGYKAFEPDWTCKGFQYEVGKTYRTDREIKCCVWGFHFSEQLVNCFHYYAFDLQNRIAEVDAIGKIDRLDDVCCTDAIRIVRELSWEEVLKLVNCGVNNTGLRNCGDENSGYWNTGSRNSGSHNSGFDNYGDYNSGCSNFGDCNTGNHNSGSCNSGGYNFGNLNTGDCNSGRWNSGSYNSGNKNTNSQNTGDFNSGCYNTGNWNSGKFNSGDYNSGDWNYGDRNVGVFNTISPTINMFDAPSDWTWGRWYNSKARLIMQSAPTDYVIWVDSSDMSENEKQDHPEYKATGGYLRHVNDSIHRQEWWDMLSNNDKNTVMSLPNFDADKFEKCTGIRIAK